MSSTNDYNTYQLPMFPDTVTIPGNSNFVTGTTTTFFVKTTKYMYWELIQREVADLNAAINPITSPNTNSNADQEEHIAKALTRIQDLLDIYNKL
jgi:hypothetical protein